MIPWLARHIACPVHERLLRRPTFRCLRELERSQWWSPDQLRSLQRDKLGRLLRHAADKTPLYRRRLREVGVTLMFSGLKHQVMRLFVQSGLVDELGRDAFFSDKETALRTLGERYRTTDGQPAVGMA